jgi:DNA end-binding protein Ku
LANAVWTGSLSLGMVVVPVRLYPAIRKKAVQFHELDRNGRRIRHVRVAEPHPEPEVYWEPPRILSPARIPEVAPRVEPGPRPRDDAPAPEVSYQEIRKGYEVAPGEYVSMTREEVMTLAPERSRVIDVQQFVDVTAVDPIYFESRYYVVPDREWASPFRLLHRTLSDANRMAIAWVTLRSRRYVSAVRPYKDLMLLTTMVHADEIAPADFWIPAAVEPSEKELKMARLLVDTLTGPFEPERYPDEHRQRLLEAIEAKTPTVAVPPNGPSPTKVLDLMAAKAARAEEEKQTKSRRRRSTGT